MGKYMIRVESMDGNDLEVDEKYADGIECDGFCILGDNEHTCSVAMHNLNIETLSQIIMGQHELMAAGILAKAKQDVIDVCRKGEAQDLLTGLLGKMLKQ